MLNLVYILTSYSDALRISVLVLEPDMEPWAILQISHGMCGCKERYLPVMEFMAGHGVLCIANDHRGHGGSVRHYDDLGYMYDAGYKALVDDMKLVTQSVRDKYPDLPLFLLGHSMGSLSARIYAKSCDDRLSGLILSGTPHDTSNAMARTLLGLLCDMGMARMRLHRIQRMASDRLNRPFADEGFQAWTCSDPKFRTAFLNDPVCNFTFTVNGTFNLMSMMREAYSKDSWHVGNPSLPVILMFGAEDPCVNGGRSIRQTHALYTAMGYEDIREMEYPYMRHEILNEVGKERVWNDILDVIKKNA